MEIANWPTALAYCVGFICIAVVAVFFISRMP